MPEFPTLLLASIEGLGTRLTLLHDMQEPLDKLLTYFTCHSLIFILDETLL